MHAEYTAARDAAATLNDAGIRAATGYWDTIPDDPSNKTHLAAQLLVEAMDGWNREQRAAEAAKREAEDREVDQYRRLIPALDPYEGVPWEVMTEQGKQMHRDRHHAHKEFFIKAHNHAFGDAPDGTCPACNTGTREPRIIQYGDPEPDRKTRWESERGITWEWAGRGWRMSTSSSVSPWGSLHPAWFPMKDVTK